MFENLKRFIYVLQKDWIRFMNNIGIILRRVWSGNSLSLLRKMVLMYKTNANWTERYFKALNIRFCLINIRLTTFYLLKTFKMLFWMLTNIVLPFFAKRGLHIRTKCLEETSYFHKIIETELISLNLRYWC